jgi:hypothetical protein
VCTHPIIHAYPLKSSKECGWAAADTTPALISFTTTDSHKTAASFFV